MFKVADENLHGEETATRALIRGNLQNHTTIDEAGRTNFDLRSSPAILESATE
jgi:hypothetical protein